MKIFKYRLDEHQVKDNEFVVHMPEGAIIRSVINQGGWLNVYAMVDPHHPLKPRKFYVYGTGQEIPPLMMILPFLGTVQTGVYVWHIFYEKEGPQG